jgi:hypothetical protein
LPARAARTNRILSRRSIGGALGRRSPPSGSHRRGDDFAPVRIAAGQSLTGRVGAWQQTVAWLATPPCDSPLCANAPALLSAAPPKTHHCNPRPKAPISRPAIAQRLQISWKSPITTGVNLTAPTTQQGAHQPKPTACASECKPKACQEPLVWGSGPSTWQLPADEPVSSRHWLQEHSPEPSQTPVKNAGRPRRSRTRPHACHLA